jgi:hypothetical protein
MADVPANPKLWNLLLRQAKAKYPSRSKNLAFPASKWLREEYARQGGSFVGSKKDVDPKLRDVKQEQEDSKKRKLAEKKKKQKQMGFLN